jgi:molecular chaperone DnaJ
MESHSSTRRPPLDVPNPYTELGLTAQSTDAEVKAAWRRLSARWHPDRNNSPAALRKIQRINRALEQIRSTRRGLAGIGEADGPAAPDVDEAPAEPGTGSASSARQGRRRSFQHTLELTLEQALAGCVRVMTGKVPDDDCGECEATGLQLHARTCAACNGSGQLRPPLWFGWMAAPVSCSDCAGQGSVRDPCVACRGSGRAPARSYRCKVRIAPGTREGELQHGLSAEEGGHPGETLALRVRLLPHPFFTLEEDGTVRCELPVDGFAWIANRWIEVPTPCGMQQMRLRRGHLVYRIKGLGFPLQPCGPRADCLVTVVPLFPESLGSRQEAQIDRLITTNTGAPGTAAGERMALWRRTLEGWRAALPEDAEAPG